MAHNQIYQWYFERFSLLMLCVLETQVHKTQVEVSKSSLGFDNSFVVNSPGRSDRLGIFWNNEIKVVFLIVYS
jgi:hypothetical protein